MSFNAGLVSEPQSEVEEDGAGERGRRGGQRADERGRSSVPRHQLSVSRGPRQEAEGALGDAAEVSGGRERGVGGVGGILPPQNREEMKRWANKKKADSDKLTFLV